MTRAEPVEARYQPAFDKLSIDDSMSCSITL